MDIKFLTQENEIQKLYSKFGLVVPVGDLSTGKAPAVQPLSTESTQTSATAKFNVMSGADITALSYTVNDGEAVSVTPTKGVITITLTDLDYNSGPYEIVITAVNENGSTSAKADVALQHYTDWAEPESVLAGNRFVVEGEEEVGTIPTHTAADATVGEYVVTLPGGYYDGTVSVTFRQKPNFLCFTASAPSEIGISASSKPPILYTSSDTENWTQWDLVTPIQLSAGEKVYMYGENNAGINHDSTNNTKFTVTGSVSVSGNILTLLEKYGNISVLADYCFADLFRDCTGITSISGLILPSTKVSFYCYCRMFQGCTGLTTLPSGLLPATTLAKTCYTRMFYGCTSLTTLPTLPATTLADSCYKEMFYGCTSLESVPSDLLPATTLADSCYRSMFYGCTSLTTLPTLPATTLADSCYYTMFNDCTGITSIPYGLLTADTLAQNCYNGMFKGCTSISNVPSDLLPAETLAQSCYNYMFSGCTSLTSFSGLPATDINTTCYQNMFSGCTGLTEAEITGEISSITAAGFTAMFDGCSSLAKITLHATTWATNRATNWVRGVAATGDFYNLGGATIATGTNGIPSGWTEHTTIE